MSLDRSTVCLSVFLTVDVVDLEEELDLVVGTLAGELVHGVDELLQADAPVVVLVENVKDALHEERLETEETRNFVTESRDFNILATFK